MKKLPILYHKAKSGKIHSWEVWVEGSTIFSLAGTLDGKKILSKVIATPKNIGKINGTTAKEQAEKDAIASHKFKLDRKYSLTPEEAVETDEVQPMLAQDFKKRLKTVKYPVSIQPKLDGCFTYDTPILTNKGYLKIGYIVDNKSKLEVLSFNEEKQIFEYKKILNYFNNGKASSNEWCEITTEDKRKIKCTWNHKILTNEGWIEAKNLNSDKHKILTNETESRLNGLILGTLLGDSCLSFDKRHINSKPRLIFAHTNENLLNFKVETLNIPGKINDYISGYGSKGKRFVSTNNINFPYEKFYYTGHNEKFGKRKLIKLNLLKKYLSDEGIALWIADDGSISYNNGNKKTPILNIATHCFSEEQINIFIDFFKYKFNIIPIKIKDKKVESTDGYYLYFNTKDTIFLLYQLQNYNVKGVEYKFIFNNFKYIAPVKRNPVFKKFTIKQSKRNSSLHKYDLEVEDNHNYIANNIVVHNCRALAYWEDGKVVLKSRGNKTWDLMEHIQKELEPLLNPNGQWAGCILDGELYVDGVEFQTLMSWIKRKQENTIQVEYHIYDMPQWEYNPHLEWTNRERQLEHFFDGDVEYKNLKLVSASICINEEEVYEAHNKYVEKGYEGAIVRIRDGEYNFGHRSYDLLKVKSFQDEEFKVVDVIEGLGKFSDCGIFVCEMPDGRTFRAVPKATEELKKLYWNNKEKYIGQFLTVTYFGKSTTGIPRFPVGKGIRPEEDLPI